MDTALTANLSERLGRAREALPNLRGEDEAQISYLTNLIETLSWILFPSAHPTCVLGRHPRPSEPSHTFCASLYSMAKGGIKYLDIVPQTGESRKDALTKLLSLVETEIGAMMLRDAKRANAVGEEKGRGRGGAASERA